MKYPEDFINKVHCADCLEFMKSMPDNSVDSIVTDPPYDLTSTKHMMARKDNLNYDSSENAKKYGNKANPFCGKTKGFMGKEWDGTGIAFKVELWKEAFRVLKSGGHLLSFGGTRTFHRMACAVEDAGFEIRDMIAWMYGSGFPKSLSISLMFDKTECLKQLKEKLGRKPTKEEFKKEWEGFRKRVSRNPNSRENCDKSNTLYESGTVGKTDYITEPVTPEAKQWEGWGTALKPSFEPICVARKPLSEKTVAENCLKWGTGGININGCRIEAKEQLARPFNEANNQIYGKYEKFGNSIEPRGRFPANLLLECICDEVIEGKELTSKEPEEVKGGIWRKSEGKPAGRTYKGGNIIHTNPECPCYMLDEQSGASKSMASIRRNKNTNTLLKKGFEGNPKDIYSGHQDTGGASRFFYCAKASRAERNAGCEGLEEKLAPTMEMRKKEQKRISDNPDYNTGTIIKPPVKTNFHPTVKPISLCEYLVKLVTPPNGIVLDPFAGSGSTLVACKKLGFGFIGIDKEKEYCEIIRKRLANIPEKLEEWL